MIEQQLKQIDIFNGLDENLLNKLSNITTVKTFEKDTILFYEGQTPKYVYALLDGQLKLYKMGLKDNEIVLHYFTTPCLVAEMTALEKIDFPASAVSMKDDTKVALIDKEKFLKLLHENNDFAFLVVRSLTKKIKNLEATINRNMVFDATLKVCSLLGENPKIFQQLKGKEIATLLNMAPETISRVLKKLKKLEIVDKDNRLEDPEKLSLFLDF